ncbi:MAG: hypothetical protein ACUVUQ_10040 [Thermodesulfovibrionales bacterium]
MEGVWVLMGNFLIIIGVTFAVLQATLRGLVSVETAGLILIATVFLIAIFKSTLIRFVAVAIPIYFFAKEYGILKPIDFMAVILNMLPLFIMLSGFYIIFRGLSSRRKNE